MSNKSLNDYAVELIACTCCGSPPGEKCVTYSAQPAKQTHRARLNPVCTILWAGEDEGFAECAGQWDKYAPGTMPDLVRRQANRNKENNVT